MSSSKNCIYALRERTASQNIDFHRPLCDSYRIVIEQTIEIPADRRITLEVPREIPVGRVILTFTPVPEGKPQVKGGGIIPEEARGQGSHPAFREAIRRAQGAWKDNPWENCIEDIRTMREEWAHRD